MPTVKRPILPKRKAVASEIKVSIGGKEIEKGVTQHPEFKTPPLSEIKELGNIEPEPIIPPDVTAEQFPEPTSELIPATKEGNFLLNINGHKIPRDFDPKKTIDPIAEAILEKLFDSIEIDASIEAFKQVERVIETTEGPVSVPESGVYVVEVVHEESDAYYVEFVHIYGLYLVYEGKWETPNIGRDKELVLSPNHERRAQELYLIRKTLEWSR